MSDENILKDYAGTAIKSVTLTDDVLTLQLVKRKKTWQVQISDEGQCCCEHRHMTTDDDPSSLVGHTLLGATLKSAEDVEDQYGNCHEQEFLEVQTTGGSITIVNHNEHNGYYGGFCIRVRER